MKRYLREMRISFWCGLFALIMLVMFANAANPYLLLALALCLGALVGYEAAAGMPLLSGALILAGTIGWSAVFASQGAVLTNAFFPWALAGVGLGLANYLMLMAIGGYLVWEVLRTADWLENKRDSAAHV